MRGEWCYFHKHFTADECEAIMSLALTIPAKEGEVGVGKGLLSVNDEIRRSKVRFIPKKDARFDLT